jgi:DNA-binding CsgD family transcriptional regulator/predicted small metal-binding protein
VLSGGWRLAAGAPLPLTAAEHAGGAAGRRRDLLAEEPMPVEAEKRTLRFTCPPCGDVFAAGDEDTLISMAVEHARKLHDLDLLDQFAVDELRQLVRRENDSYWTVIARLLPEGELRTVLEERLCEREREIVGYVVHGFTNREIASRLDISGRTVSTHVVNIYEKLNVHSRAELTALVRAADHIVEASLRRNSKREFGPFTQVNGPASR